MCVIKEGGMALEYKLLHDASKDLEAEVNRLLQQGWEPLGGVSTATQHDLYGNETTWCTQALIRKT